MSHEPQTVEGFLAESPLGSRLVKWLSDYPVDLKLGRPSKEMPADVSVIDGRVRFLADWQGMGVGAHAMMLAHDVAHFLAAPVEALHLPNLGLYGGPSESIVAKTRTLDALRTEEVHVLAYQKVLMAHLNCAIPGKNYKRMVLITATFLRTNDPANKLWQPRGVPWSDKAMAEAVEELNYTYDDLLAQWTDRLERIKARPTAKSEGNKVLTDLWAAL